jgi:threonine/homoserine/homoserine lactone efflux protein
MDHEHPMTVEAMTAFAGAFFLLALSPGPGLAAILSRALGSGTASGLAVTFGLVIGDALFLAIAMVGLSAIANAMGPMFQAVKYTGAAYLIWLGVHAWRDAGKPFELSTQASGAPWSRALWKDIGLGLMVTLGNPKPILFYGALLPTFLDLTTIGARDFAMLMSVVIVVSFLVYGGYILLIERARRHLSSTRTIQNLNKATGIMLVGSGIVVASR